MDFPIDVEKLNIPDEATLEIHRQLTFLDFLSKSRKLNRKENNWFKSIQQRHKREVEKWKIAERAWVMEDQFVKTVLIGNFIQKGELNDYCNYFKENLDEFFIKCEELQDSRIVRE